MTEETKASFIGVGGVFIWLTLNSVSASITTGSPA